MTVQPPSHQLRPNLRRSASEVFAPLQREFNRIFDDLGAGWNAVTALDLVPRMDLAETKDAVELTVELPGLTQDDVKITVEDDVLTISGEKQVERKLKDDAYRVRERSCGTFSRSVTLPRSADVEKVRATMAHGVLTITAPKAGGAAAKTIEILSAD